MNDLNRPEPLADATARQAGVAGRLVTLPQGTTDLSVVAVTVDLGGETHAVSPACVRVSRIMVLRGTPAVTLTLDLDACIAEVSRVVELPRKTGGIAAVLAEIAAPIKSAEIRLAVTVPGGALGSAAAPKSSLATAPAPANRGVYLIITTDAFVPLLEDLVDWKTRSGFDVHVATTTETGGTRQEIQAYIRNAYETWEQPPLYVVLAADATTQNVIPTWIIGTSISDHPYACVDGDDFLPDLHVGRLSAEYGTELSVQVAKIVGYESTPDTTDGGAWIRRAQAVAGNYGGATTPVSLGRWIKEELSAIGYTNIDSTYSSRDHPWYDGADRIKGYVDNGVSIVSYRGWAHGVEGWEPPIYLSSNVEELRNGWKLPVVFSIVCHTGDYGARCFGEAWMKTGTVTEPRGAVAFIGTSEPWSHSRWNDRIVIGIFESICHDGERELGNILTSTKLALIEQFPDEFLPSDAIEDPEETIYYYMHTYNLLGDPSMEIWTEPPQALTLTAPEEVPFGANFFEVTVRAAEDFSAVAGARVALSQDGKLVGYGVTNESGVASASLEMLSTNPLTVVVTGVNLYPVEETIQVAQDDYALTCVSAAAAGGGAVVPGDDADVLLTAMNTGSAAISSATAIVTGSAGVEILEGEASFGAIASGASATALDEVSIRPDASIEDGARLRFVMTPEVSGRSALAPSEFWLAATAPRLVCTATSDQGDEIIDQGETVQLVLTLKNEGSLAGGPLTGTLAAVDPALATVTDGTASWAEIALGEEGSNQGNPLVIQIAADVPGGQVIPFTLDVVAGAGPRMSVPFSLIVGPHDFSVPSGPDDYGYYAYDSADIDYPLQAPVYDWIECSPTYGGQGAKLTRIRDNDRAQQVTLPFTFTYYGAPYDTIRVGDNGWVYFETAEDTTSWYDIRNYLMPSKWGASKLVAVFWDNLAPQLAGSDGIYTWHDETRHCFVVEWSRLTNYETIDEPTTDDYQTFELLLRDPAYYPTTGGDGELIFQYKQIVDDDYTKMYSTVGIEDQTEEVGICYTYSNHYAPGAAPLSPGLAIKFTTEAPVYQPLVPLYFTAARGPGGRGGVELRWRFEDLGGYGQVAVDRAELDDEGCGGFARIYTEAVEGVGGSAVGAGSDGAGPQAAGEFVFRDREADPGLSYRYRLSAIDTAGRERVAAETDCGEALVTGPMLSVSGGGVTRGAAQVSFATGGSELCELAVYDISGRRVADLARRLNGRPAAGLVQWDGRDDRGRELASGMYWMRMGAESGKRTVRVVVVR